MDQMIKNLADLPELERIEYVIQAAKTLKKYYNDRQRSSKALFECDSPRSGPRGGKRTTLYAKHQRNCEMYDEQINHLKSLTDKVL